MQGIELKRAEYGFLKAGLSQEEGVMGGKLGFFMSDGEGMVFSTNGYVINAIHSERVYERGYYLWHSGQEMLIKVEDSHVASGKDLIESATNVRKGYLEKLANVVPLEIVSFGSDGAVDGLYFSKAAGKDCPVGFRKGTFMDKFRSICVGVNFAQVEWAADGETKQIDGSQYLVLDMKYVLSVCKYMPNAKMSWTDHKSPAFFDNGNGMSSIVMPLYLWRLSK